MGALVIWCICIFLQVTRLSGSGDIGGAKDPLLTGVHKISHNYSLLRAILPWVFLFLLLFWFILSFASIVLYIVYICLFLYAIICWIGLKILQLNHIYISVKSDFYSQLLKDWYMAMILVPRRVLQFPSGYSYVFWLFPFYSESAYFIIHIYATLYSVKLGMLNSLDMLPNAVSHIKRSIMVRLVISANWSHCK